MTDFEAIASVPYFKGLKEEAINSILEYTSVKDLSKGKYLFMSDDICNNLYLVKKGLIEVFHIGDEGKKIIMHQAGVGAILGDTIIFDEGKYRANAYAAEDTELLSIGKGDMEALIYRYPGIAMGMIVDFGRRIRVLKAFAAEIALTDVKKRIIRLLLELAGKEETNGDNTVTLSNLPTQDEMAYRIGTVREVLCKGLHKLEKDNLVKVKRGKIIICNVAGLREFILEEDRESLFPMTLPTKKLEVVYTALE